MRAETPIATGTWYHVMSLDITQCHDLTVPKLSQRSLLRRAAPNDPNPVPDERRAIAQISQKLLYPNSSDSIRRPPKTRSRVRSNAS
jgi:hypothetical protein